MFEPTENWPPGLFAVMQNGDGTAEYYRPWRPKQNLEDFVEEIARIAIVGRDSEPPVTFLRVIGSEDGEPDDAMTLLVEISMESQVNAIPEEPSRQT